jgi:cytochrome oxidase Cu insertion factor (SCO1/SenC/PrrC family)
MFKMMRHFAAFLLSSGLVLGTVQAQQTKLSPAERDTRARDYFTDTVLKTQKGRSVRFYSDTMRGKVVLINFMYTGCGDACPLITAKLVQAKNDLGETFGREVRFLSISIDPAHDRPEDLAKFAKKFDAEDASWLFLTGEQDNVNQVLKKLNAYTDNVEDHFTGIIVGSPAQGRWKKVRPDIPAKVIAEELRYFVAGEIEVRKTATAPGAAPRP